MQITTIQDCDIDALEAALQMIPQSASGSSLFEVRVLSSAFTQTKAASYTGGGIVIALPSGGSNSLVDRIKLIGVTSQGWNGPGLEISGGQNIQIVGGSYAGNGQGSGVSAGVDIDGSPENLSLVGVDLSAPYPQSGSQAAALVISGDPSTVLCQQCPVSGYSASPVSVTGSPSNLQVTDCDGYNDVNTAITPTDWTHFRHAAGNGYYGPSVLTWSSTADVSLTVNAVTYGSSKFGSIYLTPYDEIMFSAAPTKVYWFGK